MHSINLTDEQIDIIAEKAAEVAVKKLTDSAYKAIGKGVVSRFLTMVGVLTLAGYFFAQSKGWVK